MKYLHETIMRRAFIEAGIVKPSNKAGSKLIPGWWVDRASKGNSK